MNLSSSEETIGLGKITLSGDSPRLIVTDPCYKRGTWCQAIIEGCASGTWRGKAFTDDFGPWGRRVHCLAIVLDGSAQGRLSRSKHPTVAGVDSGQLGMFDESLYPEGEPGEYGDTTTFYGRACEATEEGAGAGRLDEGFVSSAGFGDGAYPIYVTRREDGVVVAVEVVFIDDDEDEGMDEEDEEAGQ